MLLELLWFAVLGLSVVPFGLYILYMRTNAIKKPWNLKIDSAYEPNLSLVVPTFEEEAAIKRKLDNIAELEYAREKMEIIVVDSASGDATVSLAREWSALRPEIRMQIICQTERLGMVNALNEAIKHMSGEIFVKTDADCLLQRDSIRKGVKYLADPHVGSVAGVHIIEASKETSSVRTEKTYREFYKWLRIGESKLWSTVLYEGELMFVKRKILDEIGFDEEIGADDVPIALRISAHGYRAITAEDANFVERTPYTWIGKFRQKTRRARHVFQALWKYKYLNFKEKTAFHRIVLPFETYVHVVNPFVTVTLAILSVPMLVDYPWLFLLAAPLLVRRIREMFATYVVNNCIMAVAILTDVRQKQKPTWSKIEEIRETGPAMPDAYASNDRHPPFFDSILSAQESPL